MNSSASTLTTAFDRGQVTEQLVRDKILHVLGIYPRVSPSMLNVAIGTSLAPAIWRPILAAMVREGLLREETVSRTSPGGRIFTHRIISLASKPGAHGHGDHGDHERPQSYSHSA